MSCPVEPEFDPLAPVFLADPFTVMRALPLADRPVFYAPDRELTFHPNIPFRGAQALSVSPGYRGFGGLRSRGIRSLR